MNRRVSSQVAAAPGGDIIEPDAKMRTRGRALQDVTNSNLQTANTKDNKVVSRKRKSLTSDTSAIVQDISSNSSAPSSSSSSSSLPTDSDPTSSSHGSNSSALDSLCNSNTENVEAQVTGASVIVNENKTMEATCCNSLPAPPATTTDQVAKKARKSGDPQPPGERATTLPPPPPRDALTAPYRIIRTLPVHSKNSDPKECLDRIDDMYRLYYDLEDQYAAKPYMENQKDINKKMRSILVDWLVEVHNRFKLQPFTLWLCINILDRYLMKMPTLRGKLQLVGVSSLLIACKYEEIYPPEVRDCVYITDYAYDREEVLAMESQILVALDYQIFVPTGFHFLSRYLNCISASERLRHLAYYYAERNLQEFDMLNASPHHMAASAIYAALCQQTPSKGTNWCSALQQESGLTEADILPCAQSIIRHVMEEPETASKRRLVACKKKFSAEKFMKVAELALPAFPSTTPVV